MYIIRAQHFFPLFLQRSMYSAALIRFKDLIGYVQFSFGSYNGSSQSSIFCFVSSSKSFCTSSYFWARCILMDWKKSLIERFAFWVIVKSCRDAISFGCTDCWFFVSLSYDEIARLPSFDSCSLSLTYVSKSDCATSKTFFALSLISRDALMKGRSTSSLSRI